MRLKLKDTPEQNALIQAMGSKNKLVSAEAQEAFAKFIGPIVQKLLLKAGTCSQIYTDAPYNGDTDNPSYPLDLYYDQGAGFVNVWSQNVAGGLPTNEVWGLSELKIATYQLDSAVSLAKRYARKCRLDVVSKAVERMAQEILVKQEINGWSVILKALADAVSTYSTTTGSKHGVAATTAGTFTFADLNNLLTLIARINSSFDGGTPVAAYSTGPTDIYTSPEIMGQIRAMGYNPIFPQSGTAQSQLPNSVREELWRNPKMANFLGINFIQMNEFGYVGSTSKTYNTLFNSFVAAGDTLFPGSNSSYWQASDEIMVAIDNSRGACVRPVDRNSDTGDTVQTQVDDQFNLVRVDKIGWFASVEEGRCVLDSRILAGVAI